MADVIDGVIDRFRDAALGLIDWEDALRHIGAVTNAHMIQLSGIDSAGQLIINRSCGISTDQMEAYFTARGYDPAVNPRSRGILEAKHLRCFTDDDLLIGTTRSNFAIYDELFHPTDAHHSAQIRLYPSAGIDLGLTLMRSRTPGAFDTEARELVERLSPGIAAACHAALALGTTRDQTIVQTAETLGGLAILLATDRRIVSMSGAAEALLTAGRGLTVRAGRLVAIDAAADRELERAFRRADHAAASEAATTRIALRAMGGPLNIDLTPLSRNLSGPLSASRVLLTMRHALDGEDAMIAAARALGLSSAESKIAAMLSTGHTLADIAERRGSAVSTVRSQLKSAFDKTGTHRQAELVMLLRRSS